MQLEARYLHQQQQQAALQDAHVQAQKLEDHAIDKLIKHLTVWQNKCAICDVLNIDSHHSLNSCMHANAEAAQAKCLKMQTDMKEKRLFAKFSGCFWCHLPQEICEKWKISSGPKGGYFMKRGEMCQFLGVMMQGWWGMIHAYDVMKDTYMHELKSRMSADSAEFDKLLTYMGQKVMFGDLKCNQLVKEFYAVCELIA